MKMQAHIVVVASAWWCLAIKRSLAISCNRTCSKVFNNRAELDVAISAYNGPNGTNGDINQWCFPNVTDMSSLLEDQTNFTYDIGCWDVSRVTNMTDMFAGAVAFNQNIGSWDVSRVIDMQWMFNRAYVFNQNIGSWDVSRVMNMHSMFNSANAFNQNIGSWNVSRVTLMPFMFHNAATFNQNIGKWNVSSVAEMSYMFYGAAAFKQNLCVWGSKLNPSVVTTNMFNGTSCPTQGSPILSTNPVAPLCAQVCSSTDEPPLPTSGSFRSICMDIGILIIVNGATQWLIWIFGFIYD